MLSIPLGSEEGKSAEKLAGIKQLNILLSSILRTRRN